MTVKLTPIIICFVIGSFFTLQAQNGFVIDHNNTDVFVIPDEWITEAQENLVVFYGHASHGSHLTGGGMTALMNYSTEFEEKYRYNEDGSNGGLRVIEPWFDLSHHEDEWVSITESNLATYPEIDIVMWAWSGMAGHDIPGYLQKMDTLINKYGPGGSEGRNVTFVYMTGNSVSYPSDENLETFEANKTIREFCIENNRILFDFNDIESYNPDGDYFGDGDESGNYVGDKRLNEDCQYRVSSSVWGNWGNEWIAENPDHILSQLAADEICTSCAHSMGGKEANSRLHCVLKGMAAWQLWARLVGWDGTDTSSNPPPTLVEPEFHPDSFLNNDNILEISQNFKNRYLVINLNMNYEKELSLQLLNMSGQLVKEIQFDKHEKQKIVSTNNMPNGVYVLISKNDKKITPKKLLVRN